MLPCVPGDWPGALWGVYGGYSKQSLRDAFIASPSNMLLAVLHVLGYVS